MKSYRKELWFNIASRRGFKNITPDVEVALRESGIQEGLTLVSAMHITASIFINDDETGLHQDYDKWLEKLAPHEPDGLTSVAFSRDGTARIYLLKIEDLMALAKQRVTRSLTTEECQQYLHISTCPAGP